MTMNIDQISELSFTEIKSLKFFRTRLFGIPRFAVTADAIAEHIASADSEQISEILKNFEKLGYVVRDRLVTDKRAYNLTSKGQIVLNRINSAFVRSLFGSFIIPIIVSAITAYIVSLFN